MILKAMTVLALVGASAAEAAEKGCMAPAEAEALVTTMLPDVLEAVGRKCEAVLPPAATLREGLAPLTARWRAEGAAVQPQAAAAVGKLVGEDVLKGADPTAMLSVMRTAIVNELVGDVKPASCAPVDRAVALASPLPARNLAGLFVLLAQSGATGKKGGDLPICKMGRP